MVDDGSNDDSVSIAKKYTENKKIFLLQHPDGRNKGVTEARALGLRFSNGEYISFLDADDSFAPLKLEKCAKVLDENPAIIMVHSAAKFLDNTNQEKIFFNEFRFHKINAPYNFLDLDYLNSNHICNSSVVVKSEYLKKINCTFSHLFQYEDWINWILLAEYGNFYYLDEELSTYRFHNNSSTYTIVDNSLKALYAKLEMLLILQTRVKNIEVIKQIENAFQEQLESIKECYCTNKVIAKESEITPVPVKHTLVSSFKKRIVK